jgi:hypothetical protein
MAPGTGTKVPVPFQRAFEARLFFGVWRTVRNTRDARIGPGQAKGKVSE